MHRKTERASILIAACGLAAAATSAHAQTVINISGATLFENFLKAPASTNDYIDVDGDGFARINLTDDQLVPSAAVPPGPQTPGQNQSWWVVQYRETGSVVGLQELINWGSVFAHGDATTGPIRAASSSKSFYNRSQFWNGTAGSGVYNPNNPGGNPVNTNETTLQATTTGGGFRVDIAPLDVPTLWGVQNTSGAAAANRNPGAPGYGTNPRVSVNAQGGSAGAGMPQLLAALGARNLFDPNNPGAADANTIFDTPVAAVPIGVVTNLGTGYQQMTQTQLRHLFATGRLPSGENLMAITREPGSGTRNGFCNANGLDPSWGVGENVGGTPAGGSVNAEEHKLGSLFVPGNKIGSGDLEATIKNVRLGVGYTGAERYINNTLVSSLELLAIKGDLSGGNTYARPTIGNLLHNSPDGYVVTGVETFATLGDPRSAPVNKGGDAGNTHPQMPNVEAAAYVNNITRSVSAFAAAPGSDPNLFTPGEFLATQYLLIASSDRLHDRLNPTTLVANGALNTNLQSFIETPGNSVFSNPSYAAFDTSKNGLVPTRHLLTSGTYSDGVAGGTNYISQGGGSISYGGSLTTRNRIAGDFNGDGKRDINDAMEMLKAYRSRNGGPAWTAPSGTGPIAGAPGADAVIEILGDFNGDGSFDAKDIRYWADGLGVDPVTGLLDRHAAFTAIDNAWQTLTGSNNFFGTTIAGGRPYHAGDSAFDVAGPSGNVARGFAPVGADGVIDSSDVAYISAQFIGNPFVTDGHANWDNISEAVGFDLSCDVTGDRVVDQADLDAINTVLGGSTCYANCDGSSVPPILNVNDFSCFLNKYAASDPYANCDGSTIPPILNVNDFTCFINRYAQGCP